MFLDILESRANLLSALCGLQRKDLLLRLLSTKRKNQGKALKFKVVGI